MGLVGNTHLIAGNADTVQRALELLRAEGVETEGNPDVYVRTYAYFGVDDARDIRERAALKASSERRVFVIATPVMTTEAQNALLKTLEEAPGDALFFIIVPNPHTLLATVRSRAQIVQIDAPASASTIDTDAFLASDAAERLDMLKPLLEKGEDDRRDVASIVMLLSSLERLLAERDRTAQNAEALRTVYRARTYLADKGALLKPLLEHVALLVPRVEP